MFRALRKFLCHVYKEVGQKYPDASYQAVGAFAFLRMVCPAITAPHLYGVMSHPVGEQTQRYLILISKIVTNIANFSAISYKEDYMQGMKDFIVENQHKVKSFIDNIVVF